MPGAIRALRRKAEIRSERTRWILCRKAESHKNKKLSKAQKEAPKSVLTWGLLLYCLVSWRIMLCCSIRCYIHSLYLLAVHYWFLCLEHCAGAEEYISYIRALQTISGFFCAMDRRAEAFECINGDSAAFCAVTEAVETEGKSTDPLQAAHGSFLHSNSGCVGGTTGEYSSIRGTANRSYPRLCGGRRPFWSR